MHNLIWLFPLFVIAKCFKFNIPNNHGNIETQLKTFFNTEEGIAYQITSSGNGFGFEGTGNRSS